MRTQYFQHNFYKQLYLHTQVIFLQDEEEAIPTSCHLRKKEF